MIRDIDYRERRLREFGIPENLINVYVYSLVKKTSYLIDEYIIEKNGRMLVDRKKVREDLSKFNLLMARIVIFGDIVKGEL